MRTDFLHFNKNASALRPREELKEDGWESGLQYVRGMGLNPVLDQGRFYEIKFRENTTVSLKKNV